MIALTAAALLSGASGLIDVVCQAAEIAGPTLPAHTQVAFPVRLRIDLAAQTFGLNGPSVRQLVAAAPTTIVLVDRADHYIAFDLVSITYTDRLSPSQDDGTQVTFSGPCKPASSGPAKQDNADPDAELS